MNSFQVVLEKIFMNNFLLSEEIPYAFPKLFGNFSWVLGQCSFEGFLQVIFHKYIPVGKGKKRLLSTSAQYGSRTFADYSRFFPPCCDVP
jgi:hypothetical protein